MTLHRSGLGMTSIAIMFASVMATHGWSAAARGATPLVTKGILGEYVVVCFDDESIPARFQGTERDQLINSFKQTTNSGLEQLHHQLWDQRRGLISIALTETAGVDLTPIRVDRLPSGNVAFTGRVHDPIAVNHDAWAHLIIGPKLIIGSISIPGSGMFAIRILVDGESWIREINPIETMPGGCGVRDAAPRGNATTPHDQPYGNFSDDQPTSEAFEAMEPGNAGSTAGFAPSGVPLCGLLNSPLAGYTCDDGTTVDLMVYYTQAAMSAAGGQAAMEAEIDLAVLYANNAYDNSQINVQIRVVRKALTSYVESNSAIVNLDRMVATNDGFLDFIHAERDQYGADLVSLWTGNALDSGGVAYQPVALSPYEDGRFTFSVMREDNALFETLAHELGHNFGCQHDRCDNNLVGFFDDSYGYRQLCPGESIGNCGDPLPCTPNKTIMAYPPGMTIPYFSNPNVDFAGAPTGGVDELGLWCDNAGTINTLAFTIANIRPTAVTSAPARVYVRSDAPNGGDGVSWSTALNDMQDAIQMAAGSNGAVQEVWVAAGTYLPDRGSGDRLRLFKPVQGVTFYGGFDGTETLLSQRDVVSNITRLSGDIGAVMDVSDNSCHVISGIGVDATAVLDGCWIEGGYADLDYPNNSGAGASIRCGSPTFRNCTFNDNHATFVGGAAQAEYATPTFVGCTFSLNSAQYGGAIEHYQSPAVYDACRFEFNAADFAGGAVHCNQSGPIFTTCMFNDNVTIDTFGSGGAIRCFDQSTPQLTDCTFEGNHSYAGGALRSDSLSHPTVSDTTFTDNSAAYGAAVEHYNASGTFADCTFDINVAGVEGNGSGGAMYNSEFSTIVATHCTFTGNNAGFSGGGVSNYNCTALFDDCRFIGNESEYGGAAYNDGDPLVQYTACRFNGNFADFGGGGVYGSDVGSPVLISCLFTGNVSGFDGGAAYCWGNNSTEFLNCTFALNSANFSGGGLAVSDSTPHLDGSILWGNTSQFGTVEDQQLTVFSGDAFLDYCVVQGWSGFWGGIGNFGTNPLFIDINGDDNVIGTVDDRADLNSLTPCAESGNPIADARVVAESDINGSARVTNCRIDIGAAELAGSAKNSGDMDGNGSVNSADVALFVNVLLNGGTPSQICAGDLNGDLIVDGDDIQMFVAAIE